MAQQMDNQIEGSQRTYAEMSERIETLEAQNQEMLSLLAAWVSVESDKCRSDHHGVCYEHNHFDLPCPVARAREILQGCKECLGTGIVEKSTGFGDLQREQESCDCGATRARQALENIKVHAGRYSECFIALGKCGQIARWGLGDDNAFHEEPLKAASRPPDVPGSGRNPHPSVRNMVG